MKKILIAITLVIFVIVTGIYVGLDKAKAAEEKVSEEKLIDKIKKGAIWLSLDTLIGIDMPCLW